MGEASRAGLVWAHRLGYRAAGRGYSIGILSYSAWLLDWVEYSAWIPSYLTGLLNCLATQLIYLLLPSYFIK